MHKLNNGLARSFAALSNQKANHNKLNGKWGADIWEVVERGIELSREGRYLPDDGDTSAWLSQGPSADFFPRTLPAHPRRKAALLSSYDELAHADANERVACWVKEYLAHAAHLQRHHGARLGLELLHNAINFAPARIDVLAALARAYRGLGQSDFARTIATRALMLDPNHAELLTLTQLEVPLTSVSCDPNPAPHDPVPATAPGLRVLMVNTFEDRAMNADQHQLIKTREHLQQRGVHVDLCCTARPDPRGYDVVHVWHSAFPVQTLAQVKAIRAQRPDIAIVHTPNFCDQREKCWADAVVSAVFSQSPTPALLEERLKQIAADQYPFQGRTRAQARESNYRGFNAYQRAIFPLIDQLLPHSRAEVANLKKVHGIEKPFSLVPNAVEADAIDAATPDWFAENYGVKDFILVTGIVEPRGNQLMLLHGLRDTGLPVVVIGGHQDRHYYALCRRHAPKGTVFIDQLSPGQLASAFKAAKVHALPSWVEFTASTNLQAALSGCALVVSDRTSEREYFGANAYYCDPANVISIRNAVVQAHRNHAPDAPKRVRLIEQFRRDLTWTRAAEATLAAYESAIAQRRARAAA